MFWGRWSKTTRPSAFLNWLSRATAGASPVPGGCGSPARRWRGVHTLAQAQSSLLIFQAPLAARHISHVTAAWLLPPRQRHQEDNADAHLKRSIMGREVVVAVTGGRLDFGPWEQIFYGEFDGLRRKRVLVKIIGE